MNCQEIEPIITDLARNSAIEVEAQDRALAHLSECRRCAGRLAEEKRLTEGLRTLASLEDQAPARVEEKIRAAFRRRQPVPLLRRRGWLTIAAAGSIAAAIVLFKLPAPRPVASPSPPPTVAVVAAQDPTPVIDTRKTKQAPRRPRRKSVQPEIATEFLPVAVDDGWTPLDGGRLVRVKLPRTALGVFGLPVEEGFAPERVQADVMLSNDGILRAIRFVR